MCAMSDPVYVYHGRLCIYMLCVFLYICAMSDLYMCDMDGLVYVCYGWPCTYMLWVTVYVCAMGDPVYV